jgi:hypothetical protein
MDEIERMDLNSVKKEWDWNMDRIIGLLYTVIKFILQFTDPYSSTSWRGVCSSQQNTKNTQTIGAKLLTD